MPPRVARIIAPSLRERQRADVTSALVEIAPPAFTKAAPDAKPGPGRLRRGDLG